MGIETSPYSRDSGGNPLFDLHVQTLRAAEPDAIVANWFQDSDALSFSQASAKGQLGAPLIFGSLLSGEAVAQPGNMLEGYVATGAYAPELAQNRAEFKALNELFQRLPDRRDKRDFSDVALKAFTGFMVLMDAFNRAKSVDPEVVRKALAGTRIPSTQLLMPWPEVRFDEKGQNVGARGVLRQVRNGKHVTVYPGDVAITGFAHAKDKYIAFDKGDSKSRPIAPTPPVVSPALPVVTVPLREAIAPSWMGSPKWPGMVGKTSPSGLLWYRGLSETLAGKPEDSAKAWLEQNVVKRSFGGSTIQLQLDEHRGGQLFYQQKLNGVPVRDRSLRARYSQGILEAVSGEPLDEKLERSFLVIPPAPSVAPNVVAAEAVSFIKIHVAQEAEKGEQFQAVEAPDLFYGEFAGNVHLAWRILVESRTSGIPRGLWEVWADAHKGQMLLHSSLIRRAHGDVDAAGTGADGRSKVIRTYHPQNGQPYLAWDRQAGIRISRGEPGRWASHDKTIWDTGIVGGHRESSQAPEVDALHYLGIAKKYFRRVFNVDVSGAQGGPLEVIVHDRDSAAANWNPRDRFLRFGDGDGRTLNFMTGELEIVAHEYGHAVIDELTKTALRCTGKPGEESAALNESLADVLGLLAALDYYGRTARGGTWVIGKHVYLDGSYRDLQDPSKGGKYSKDDTWNDLVKKKKPQPMTRQEKLVWMCSMHGGAVAHINSSIPSRVAFLLLNGGTVNNIRVDPITFGEAEKLYNGMLPIFGRNQGQNFEMALYAMLEAAGKVWPTGEKHCAIVNAWAVVGVAPEPCTQETGR